MERPCLSRRHALLLPASAAGLGTLAACGPGDEGFGDAQPLRADDGGVSLDDVPENESTLVNFGGEQPFVLLVRGTGEDITAYSGYCTHNGCALSQKQDELDCPCHGSKFDSSNGEVLVGPATRQLPEVSVVVEEGLVRRAG
ncbi:MULTISPECIES: QcrA and Rieske domain-containing protein [Brachybacterium]|jgi:Rieske Fe-S protein|uniref:Cytochrome bc1 complex Rieske iron-sulfur subunit n=1 Tax=Brachybacterium alimentarium TaxID=47845 RepID=A0A2A3YLL6_9MICO|nr:MULTISPECIES: Rieske (2Fe-2S) protein [Brachybacterium]PCC34819.1 ferredoxin [Brachybacterium alimentarium]PCC40197.1 ferredoxin [Brachybacterium alimentarium]RCS60271.1 Rieske (2Fe-2S) protein [Brachybacterium sp. JB7]RCS69019.1 Rieske (2Fe-2S) protein [Brachybacterium alimentarium]RCS75946.1 Rieske (2Fe-2S) protein [Brachybacterium alimentarium]